VNGSVDLSGASLSGLKVKLRLAGEKISFALNSVGEYKGQIPRTEDLLTLSMTSTPVTLTAMSDQIAAGTFGVAYTNTKYKSVYFSLNQVFGSSTFYIKSDATGYFWEGNYLSTITKESTNLYQKGLLSQRQQNYTEYYCDEARTQRVGVATHDLDLKGGTFIFEDGKLFTYRLDNF
jgi:hypothetical protein